MARPLKGKKPVRTFSFTLSGENEEIMKKADELAFRENKSRGDIILRALADYLRLHAPSNPQLNIYANSEDLSMTDRISLNFMRRQVREKVETLGGLPATKVKAMRAGYQTLLIKASKVYDRTRDGELKSLIEKLEGLLGNGT